MLHGATVTPTSWSETTITFAVPATATTDDVVVTTDVSSNGVRQVGDELEEYYHTDAIGSVQLITGPTGAVLERHDYLPLWRGVAAAADAAHIGFTDIDAWLARLTAGEKAPRRQRVAAPLDRLGSQ